MILGIDLSDTLSNGLFIIGDHEHIGHLELILSPLAEMIHHLMSLHGYESVLKLFRLRLLIPIARLTVYIQTISLDQLQFIEDRADVQIL